MYKRLSLVFGMLFASLTTYGARVESAMHCTGNGHDRLIELVRMGETGTLPCQVRYTKNGVEETPYRASNTEGFCENGYEHLKTVNIGNGLNCSAKTNEAEKTTTAQ